MEKNTTCSCGLPLLTYPLECMLCNVPLCTDCGFGIQLCKTCIAEQTTLADEREKKFAECRRRYEERIKREKHAEPEPHDIQFKNCYICGKKRSIQNTVKTNITAIGDNGSQRQTVYACADHLIKCEYSHSYLPVHKCEECSTSVCPSCCDGLQMACKEHRVICGMHGTLTRLACAKTTAWHGWIKFRKYPEKIKYCEACFNQIRTKIKITMLVLKSFGIKDKDIIEIILLKLFSINDGLYRNAELSRKMINGKRQLQTILY